MINVNDKKFKYYGMPVHNPLCGFDEYHFRSEAIHISLQVKNPEVIANIVPAPLIYNNNEITFGLNSVKELGGDLVNEPLWDELAIRIPVTYNAKPKTFICEIYTSTIFNTLDDRETFGLPKIPSSVSIDKNNFDFNVKVEDCRDREICLFNFKANNPPEAPVRGKKPERPPAIVVFKYIRSATLGNRPEVKQLIEMQYKEPKLHKIILGEGNVELLQGAPGYLKEAGIAKIGESLYHEVELTVVGGKIIHDYIKEKGGSIWQRLLRK